MTWTCRRVTNKQPCGHKNTGRSRKCASCGKPRPARRKPAHMAALRLPYEHYVRLNGGEFCGICGVVRKPDGKRLHRDHDHRTGKPRGVLCFLCNSALRPYMTAEWVRAALAYLERTENA